MAHQEWIMLLGSIVYADGYEFYQRGTISDAQYFHLVIYSRGRRRQAKKT